jgi:hypothetical protein
MRHFKAVEWDDSVKHLATDNLQRMRNAGRRVANGTWRQQSTAEKANAAAEASHNRRRKRSPQPSERRFSGQPAETDGQI